MAEIGESDTDSQPDVDSDDRAIHHINGNTKDVDHEKMDISETSLTETSDVKSISQEQITAAEEDFIQSDDKENIFPVDSGGDHSQERQEPRDGHPMEEHMEHPVEKKLRMEGHLSDSMSTGSQDSEREGKPASDCPSNTSSKPNSAEGARKSPTHKQDKDKTEKDALRKEKDREREERIRQQREKLAQERQQKIDEMREQQRAAQEKREKQLEARRMKIDELRRREEERRKEVEERRRKQDEEDKARKEAIIMKSKERITRYEQWKAQTNTRKGLYMGTSPPSKHLSVSTSVLYHKRQPEFSSSGNLSARDRPESLLAPSSKPPTRPKSTVNLSHRENVKLRERTTPRKPRPSSVAGSTPSVTVTSPASKATQLRSKSTDRLSRPRDRSKPGQRITPKKEKDEQNKQEKALDSKDDKKADTKRPFRSSTLERKKKEDAKKKEEAKKEELDTSKSDKPAAKVSMKTLERLSTPKNRPKTPPKVEPKEASPVKTKSSPKHVEIKESPKQTKKKSTSPVPPSVKPEVQAEKVETEETGEMLEPEAAMEEPEVVKVVEPEPVGDVVEPEETLEKGAVELQSPEEKEVALPEEQEAPVTEKEEEVPVVEEEKPEVIEEPEAVEEVDVLEPSTDEERPVTPQQNIMERAVTPPKPETTERSMTPTKLEPKSSPAKQKATPSSTTATPTSKSQKEQELEEYKAKLAEKRRQAREKAEREAELERQRQEEIRRQEEERIRKEEEEQRKAEEEAQRLAQIAKEAEEERLRKAIEAAEERRKQEAEKAEQERLQKEEAEKKAKEEAERAELERLEKVKRDEEERQERKKYTVSSRVTEFIEKAQQERMERSVKFEQERLERKRRLEMIMKRVKSDSPMTASASTDNLKNDVMTSSLSGSMTKLYSSSENLLEDKKTKENGVTFNIEDTEPEKSQTPSTGASKFKSPLLQKLVENKPSQNGGSETPKFKSPLLQSILGRKSRLGVEKSDGDKSDSEALSDSEKADDRQSDSRRVSSEQKQESAAKVEITPDPSSIDSEDSSAGTESRTDACDDNTVIGKEDVRNGCVHNGETTNQELVDSSVSMRTIDSSITTDDSISGSLIDSQSQGATDSHPPEQFEEYIDLSVSNRGVDVHSSSFGTSDDLLNYNTRHSLDNRDAGEEIIPKPIIAFEDNATRRQEVSDYLS